MRDKDGDEVEINKLWVTHSGEAQLGTIQQRHQPKGEPSEEPAVIDTGDACVEPEKKSLVSVIYIFIAAA